MKQYSYLTFMVLFVLMAVPAGIRAEDAVTGTLEKSTTLPPAYEKRKERIEEFRARKGEKGEKVYEKKKERLEAYRKRMKEMRQRRETRQEDFRDKMEDRKDRNEDRREHNREQMHQGGPHEDGHHEESKGGGHAR